GDGSKTVPGCHADPLLFNASGGAKSDLKWLYGRLSSLAKRGEIRLSSRHMARRSVSFNRACVWDSNCSCSRRSAAHVTQPKPPTTKVEMARKATSPPFLPRNHIFMIAWLEPHDSRAAAARAPPCSHAHGR